MLRVHMASGKEVFSMELSDFLDQNPFEFLPVFRAVRFGHADKVEQLLQRRHDPNVTDNAYKWTPLHTACAKGCIPIDSSGCYSATPLSVASRCGRIDVVKLLLEAGVDKDKPNAHGETPLAVASDSCTEVAVVRLLLDARADTNKANKNGETPLLVASLQNCIRVVRLLLEARADHEQSDCNGEGPLLVASEKGHSDVVQLLLEARADKDRADQSGETPLTVASAHCRPNVVRLLLEARADQGKSNGEGKTAWHLASIRNHREVLALLSDEPSAKRRKVEVRFVVQPARLMVALVATWRTRRMQIDAEELHWAEQM
eukprot:s1146_g1.t1